MRKVSFALVCCCAGLSAFSADDWLIDHRPYVARVTETEGRLILENGLVRREIALRPGFATVSLKNLVSGEEFVRAVTAESRVSFDGRSYPVGGLEGQEVLNYLKPEWIAGLSPLVGSYAFARVTVGPIAERFAWKKRPEWMARDLPWPPKGRHVSLSFLPPVDAQGEDDGEEVLAWDSARLWDSSWTVGGIAPGDDETTCRNEGFPGQIWVEKKGMAYLEHAWPEGASIVRVRLDCGTDTEGPADSCNELSTGVSITAMDENCIENTSGIALSPARHQFYTIAGGASLEKIAAFDVTRAATLVIERRGNAYFAHAEQDGVATGEQALVLKGRPVRFQVGKVAASQGQGWARLHVHSVSCRRAKDVSHAPRADLPAVEVHYEIYDGAPLIAKWLVVSNSTSRTVTLDDYLVDEIRLAEKAAPYDAEWHRPDFNIYAESNFAFAHRDRVRGAGDDGRGCGSVRFGEDRAYYSQLRYSLDDVNTLRAAPFEGGAQRLRPGETCETMRVWELLFDSEDRRRRGFSLCRMYRLIAPWVTENPFMFHCTDARPETVRDRIDQCERTGFDLVILSFKSGHVLQSTNADYRAIYRRLADEAHAKGVEIGSYSLSATLGEHRHFANPVPETDRLENPSPCFGPAPCFQSAWGLDYLGRLRASMDACAFGFFENDGPYPGDWCAATNHPGHFGKSDSTWRNWQAQAGLYRWCRARGVFVNQPDWYYLEGGSKGCGQYREQNNSLPRAQQLIIERQNIYDSTWTLPSCMRFMFVPLSVYQGGGAAATVEPIGEHRS